MCCTSLLSNALQEWKDLLKGSDFTDDQAGWTPSDKARGEITTTNQQAVKLSPPRTAGPSISTPVTIWY
jgi:hypothetical protein